MKKRIFSTLLYKLKIQTLRVRCIKNSLCSFVPGHVFSKSYKQHPWTVLSSIESKGSYFPLVLVSKFFKPINRFRFAISSTSRVSNGYLFHSFLLRFTFIRRKDKNLIDFDFPSSLSRPRG